MLEEPVLRVSFSALDTYEQCPRKYFYGYIQRLPKKDWPWLVFGTFSHLVLEKFHKYIVYFQKRKRAHDYGDLMGRAFMSALRVQRRLEKKGKMILSNLQKEEVKRILAGYLKANKDNFPKVIKIEKGFDFHMGNINIRGYIDRIDNPSENVYEMIDYKTSSKTYEVSKNKQLDLYAYSFKRSLKYPDAAIIRKKLNFLKHGIVKEEDYTPKHEKEVLEFVKEVSSKIIKNMKSDEEDWKFKVNGFCRMCDFSEQCKSQRGIFI